MLLASAIGFLGMVAGLYISYYAETQLALVSLIIFVAVFCWSVYWNALSNREWNEKLELTTSLVYVPFFSGLFQSKAGRWEAKYRDNLLPCLRIYQDKSREIPQM